ncbi:hypothetical protein Y1Q_0019870 [Alligator mississippiensis]|uniref:Uncharacterized protein n=1 Tax=Alligator mississippiensis TaxID=8496 RepID=A0A151PFF2_ALLMI|nr:hypothetical protein Y1Q_0019870 [Alligator mississippiensis]
MSSCFHVWKKTSETLRNHLLHLTYSKRDQLKEEINTCCNNLEEKNSGPTFPTTNNHQTQHQHLTTFQPQTR